MDTDTGNMYICIDADLLQKTYSWRITGSVDRTTLQQTLSDYVADYPVLSGILTSAALNLLIEILESAVYNANVTGKIASLKEALHLVEVLAVAILAEILAQKLLTNLTSLWQTISSLLMAL